MSDFFSVTFLETLRDRVLPGVWPLLAAMVLCALLVPVAIRVSRRTGLMAVPGGRHAHAAPTPLLGGLAMFIGFAVAVLVFVPSSTTRTGVLVVSGLAAVLLIADDRWPVSPGLKFAFQLLVALVAVGVFGFVITYFGLPNSGTNGNATLVYLGWAAIPVSLFWILGMQNTVNFLDGVDGLASGVIFIVALTLLIAAAGRDQIDVVRLAGALAGTCAGFLLFNFNPARIFMGDSGSHFLGAALAVISILGVAKVAVAFALVIPILALALPIADTAWAIVRRRRGHESVARPDLQHLHHRLQAFGLTPRQTCYVFYAATALFGTVGLMFFGHRRILAVVVVAALVLASTVAADRLQKAGVRIPAPLLRRLLAEPGNR
ncbi:MAG TPA: MraY family glycosyltransferase [Candidatus Dormibacteraeota bacterium]|nr:MraY family glycosyltransferase [Candidatus Dormibacteraeota bacterium]